MLPLPQCRPHMPCLGSTSSSNRDTEVFPFSPHNFLFNAASTVSTSSVKTTGLSGAPCGRLLVVLIFSTRSVLTLICQLCCSHSFEIHARCCLSTPCSFIAFHCFQFLVSVRMVQTKFSSRVVLRRVGCSKLLLFCCHQDAV